MYHMEKKQGDLDDLGCILYFIEEVCFGCGGAFVLVVCSSVFVDFLVVFVTVVIVLMVIVLLVCWLVPRCAVLFVRVGGCGQLV